ncbi:hypothetical protein OE88DRAFT_1651928 [Heliocybe sulcata]|uniref:TPR-like protein n=1 Tax=Heliocybe sulcata TaxID=5364 RepID=A0A5C3NHK7_9AGAM|nr:hypothetical protein OE88DRAFT_1651928 [Heliocybe sulcata]
MMLRYPEEKQSILRELALRLIQAEKYREALEELDLYLPSFPHQDNPVLHAYAGLVALYLSQSERVSQISDAGLLRMAKGHLERSRTLDPDNTVVQAFLDKISTLSQPSGTQIAQEEAHDSEEDVMNIDGDVQPRKRARA